MSAREAQRDPPRTHHADGAGAVRGGGGEKSRAFSSASGARH
jgi:hypothetical protein